MERIPAQYALSLFLLLPMTPVLAATDSFDIAITVDDMPVHGPLPRGMSWLGITETHLKVFKANGVPEAFGFVNASKLAVSSDGEAALEYLYGRGYKVADVSVAFNDWVYTDAYARCVAKENAAAIASMKAEYLAGVDSAISRMKADSRQVFGRVIPQVLLTHLGGWSAITLPDVMARLNAAGARYVTLREAQSDPAYSAPGGGSVISRAARLKGIQLPVSEPAATPLEVGKLCR